MAFTSQTRRHPGAFDSVFGCCCRLSANNFRNRCNSVQRNGRGSANVKSAGKSVGTRCSSSPWWNFLLKEAVECDIIIIIIIIIQEFHPDASLETKLQGHVQYQFSQYLIPCMRCSNRKSYQVYLPTCFQLHTSVLTRSNAEQNR